MTVAICIAAIVLLLDRRRLERTMRQLDEMLDAAIRDEFKESAFDESLQSAVESKQADYLSASAVSARNLRTAKGNMESLILDIFHQTKTPLANILLYTQLLSEQDLPEASCQCAAALEGQAEKFQRYTLLWPAENQWHDRPADSTDPAAAGAAVESGRYSHWIAGRMVDWGKTGACHNR